MKLFKIMMMFLFILPALPLVADNESQIPQAWVDPETGHHVRLISRRDAETSNSSFYFHQNAFTPDGKEMVYAGTAPEGRRLFSVNLDTLETRKINDRDSAFENVGTMNRTVYYRSGRDVCVTHIDSGETRIINTLPEAWTSGRGFAVNADETLLAGCFAKGEAEFYATQPRSKWFDGIWEAHLPNMLYTIDIQTGKINEILHENEWLGHVQFSPTDPKLLMFCHEGPWHKLDRIWTICADGSGKRLMHRRSMEMEIAGHEFWGPAGEWIWFDLHKPKRVNFFLAGVALKSGETREWRLAPNQWSVHYNVSPDGMLFCGDGGSARMNGGYEGGKWIYLYRPVDSGLEVEKLCSMEKHDYHLEPNVRFTPDGKWVVFRSNMHGRCRVYAVEVEKKKENR